MWDLRDRYALDEGGAVFRMKVRTNEDDFGNYSCAIGGAAPAITWELRGRPHAKIAPNTNVVEGQKLKLQCKVSSGPARPAPGPGPGGGERALTSACGRWWASRTPPYAGP